MGRKKAQIALFIIIALMVVLIIIILTIAFSKQKSYGSIPEISNIQNQIQNCLDSELESALLLVGLQGGYTSPPKGMLIDYRVVAFFYYNGSKSIPELRDIENEIELYLNFSLDNCFKNVSIPKNTKIEDVEKRINVRFFKNKIVADLKWPIKISFNEKTYILGNFKSTFKSSMYTFLQVAKELVAETMKNPKEINVEKIYELSNIFHLDIRTTLFENYENSSIIFYQIKELEDEKIYNFLDFAIKLENE